MNLKFKIIKILSTLKYGPLGLIPKYMYATPINSDSDIEYFIHISPNIDEIIKSKKLIVSTNDNLSHNISNNHIPAIYGFPNIPSRLQFYRQYDMKAIKIKLDDNTKKIIKQRKADKALLISITDLDNPYLDLNKYDYEIIDIPC